MKQRIGNGAILDAVTSDEMASMLIQEKREVLSRVRAPFTVTLTATGSAVVAVYKVPAAMEFELRRISLFIGGLTLPTGNTPGTNFILLGGATPATGGIALLRSDVMIEWLAPQGPQGAQLPGVQTWSKQQGPYMRNGEVLQIQVVGALGTLTAGASLAGVAEGVLTNQVPVDG